MNLLENYIVEVYSVKTENVDYDGNLHTLVIVDMMTNCYGGKSRTEKTFLSLEEWERVKKLGYYMG